MRLHPLFIGSLALLILAACNPTTPVDDQAASSATLSSMTATPSNGAQEGELCGGIAGFICAKGLTCLYEGNYPDAAGTCVKESSVPSAKPIDILDPSRITKKPFGIRIDRATSPVQPERFSGWHTAADFEVMADEDEEAIPVPAICDGPVLSARSVSGYGGVLVQRCDIGGKTVTVLYGHLDPATLASGDLKITDIVGFLGKGFSAETDNERPHLHLGIHKGPNVELKGYVQNESDLSEWIDPVTVLP